jgi:hypothetical protein
MVMAIKVSQSTIDKIKKMGMTAALKSAPKANAEMTEALRRMYGQRRLDAATGGPAKQPRQGAYSTGKQPRQGTSGVSLTRTPTRRGATSGPMSANTPARRNAVTSGPISANKPAISSTKATKPTTKTPTARPTAAQIKAGESRAGGAYKYKPSTAPTKTVKTAAQKAKEVAATAARRKAAADAVKRAGGRTR